MGYRNDSFKFLLVVFFVSKELIIENIFLYNVKKDYFERLEF